MSVAWVSSRSIWRSSSLAELGPRSDPPSLVGGSSAIRRAREMIEQIAESDATAVFIEGETGTGKKVVARAIHLRSARAGSPFLSVDCSALPEALVDAGLFGQGKGALAAAHPERAGIFDAASGGTVLLDEMGDLPASAQAKLLRFLENKTYRTVGGIEERVADVRVIAATRRGMAELAANGEGRSDLFCRLDVARIVLPPLRERREDIAVLVASFISRSNERFGRSVRGITHEAMDLLERHPWPGNVGELRNVIERAFVLYPQMEELHPGHFPECVRRLAPGRTAPSQMPADLAVPDTKRWLIADAMRRAGGNQSRAARLLGVPRSTLRYRLRKQGIGWRRGRAVAERPEELCSPPNMTACQDLTGKQ
jgi:transcriptional regulator with PAS, ATPase and Fis domain